jgi:hypothetical protein
LGKTLATAIARWSLNFTIGAAFRPTRTELACFHAYAGSSFGFTSVYQASFARPASGLALL